MDSLLNNLPKKCYACASCQKFTATLNQDSGEQMFCVRNDSTFSENLEQQGGERTNSNIDDTNKFINDYSVRNRLRMLGQPQNNVHKLNIHDMAAFYAPSNRTQIRSNFNFNPSRLNSNTNFRLTLNVIMVPFINSNRLVTVDVEHWEILSDLGLIQDVTFTDESAVGIEQTLTEIIPIIQETGRQVLRPINQNSLNLII
ncbi:unnamed protein product [Rhizophagus irregularis]|nr:unnamed protein product [Rhizophagus irregularis]